MANAPLSLSARRGKLTGQSYEILRLLLERPGEVVEREELRQRLWPGGTFVDFEHSLNAAIKRLRAALGDSPDNPRFVETIPRRGYRWVNRSMVRPRRIAIHPFSGVGANEEFVRGLMGELTAELGRRGAGRLELVWPRLAQHDGPPLDYVLEGSARCYGDRVRVGVWVVDVRQGIQIWSDIYEGRIVDAVPAQIDISSMISADVIERIAPTPASACSPSPLLRETSHL